MTLNAFLGLKNGPEPTITTATVEARTLRPLQAAACATFMRTLDRATLELAERSGVKRENVTPIRVFMYRRGRCEWLAGEDAYAAVGGATKLMLYAAHYRYRSNLVVEVEAVDLAQQHPSTTIVLTELLPMNDLAKEGMNVHGNLRLEPSDALQRESCAYTVQAFFALQLLGAHLRIIGDACGNKYRMERDCLLTRGLASKVPRPALFAAGGGVDPALFKRLNDCDYRPAPLIWADGTQTIATFVVFPSAKCLLAKGVRFELDMRRWAADAYLAGLMAMQLNLPLPAMLSTTISEAEAASAAAAHEALSQQGKLGGAIGGVIVVKEELGNLKSLGSRCEIVFSD